MKKVVKASKKGFSLVEMICVLAIIVILASVLLINYVGLFRDLVHALETALC